MDAVQPAFFTKLLAAHAVAALTMASISSTNTGARLASVSTLTFCCLRAISAAEKDTVAGQTYAEYAFGFILHAISFLLLSRLSAPRDGKTKWQRLEWSIVALFSPRRDLKIAHNPPGRRIFILLRLILGLLQTLLYRRLSQTSILPLLTTLADYPPSRDSLLPQILTATLTIRELLIRLEDIIFSLLKPALLLNAAHCYLSSLFVCLLPHRTKPADWPPLFGNILDAWSVRRWYSHFWEKLMRRAFTANAAFLTSHILRLRPGSTAGRCSIILLSFALSGIMHVVAGWTPGPCTSWAPMWGYLVTGVVILGESAVLEMYERVMHSSRGLGLKWRSWEAWGWRVLGYCWVAFFWLETVPRLTRPGMRCHWMLEMEEPRRMNA